MGGVAKMPAAALWLLLVGVVVALGVAATPAHAFRNKTNHYDFIVSRRSISSEPELAAT